MQFQIKPQNYFKLENGIIIKSVDELPEAIETLDDKEYNVHVNPTKNDFAAWVNDVYGMRDLSAYMRNSLSKEELQRTLRAYLRLPEKMPKTSAGPQSLNVPVGSPNVIKAAEKKAISADAEMSQKVPSQFTWKQDQVKPRVDQEIMKPKEDTVLMETKPHSLPEISKKSEQTKSEAISTEQKTEIPGVQASAAIPKKTAVEPMTPVQVAPTRKESEADRFFIDHPIIIENMLEKKKEQLSLEALPSIRYTGLESPDILKEMFKDAYVKAYEKLVFLRKNGFDTKLCEMMLFRIPTKIKVYDSTKTEKDAILIKRYLNEITEELNNFRT